jgi:hypothetical protein
MATESLNSTVNDHHGAISINDEFNRLSWSIFENISNIRVLGGPKTSNLDLLLFVGHAIATESPSQIPLTEIAFLIYDLAAHHSEFSEYTAPEDLRVSRADSGIITVQDVVEQLSVYFETHKEDILMAKEDDEETTADTRVFFEGFFGMIEPISPSLPVILWAEGENGFTYEDHLAENR